MGLLIFPPNDQLLVGDASVWISLVASGHSEAILRAIPNRVVITDVAIEELERGRARGRSTIEGVEKLISAKLLSTVVCPEEAEPIYFELLGGTAAETLDDGEACTLAYALYASGCAVIDEKKATAIANRRFPQLTLSSTVDLMLSQYVQVALGPAKIADALYAALMDAKMRVPFRLIAEVYNLLGADRTARCPSLPRQARSAG